MSARDKPPFRADHVGSLLRPKSLLKAREDAASGAISEDELREQEDDAIRDVIKLEQDVGLHSITDGELRRASWHMDFIYQIAGVEKVEQKLKSVFHNAEGDLVFTPSAVRISGKLGMDHTIFGPAFEFLRDTVRGSAAGGTPKLTIPAPSLVHYRNGPPRSTPTSTRTWSCSGMTSAPLTPTRSAGSARWAARTFSSTTRASPT